MRYWVFRSQQRNFEDTSSVHNTIFKWIIFVGFIDLLVFLHRNRECLVLGLAVLPFTFVCFLAGGTWFNFLKGKCEVTCPGWILRHSLECPSGWMCERWGQQGWFPLVSHLLMQHPFVFKNQFCSPKIIWFSCVYIFGHYKTPKFLIQNISDTECQPSLLSLSWRWHCNP